MGVKQNTFMEEYTTIVNGNELFKGEHWKHCRAYPFWHITIVLLYRAALDLLYFIVRYPYGQIVSKNQLLMK